MTNRIVYLIFALSIIFFIYTFIFLKPVELLKPLDDDGIVEYTFQNFDTIGLEGKEQIAERYRGSITLDRVWIKIKLIFSSYLPEVINSNMSYKEYYDLNIDKVKEEFGIDNYKDFKNICNSFTMFNNEFSSIVLKEESIQELDDGISFKVILKDVNNIVQIYDFILYNNDKQGNVMYKILLEQEVN